jgi:hypothetical protein
MSGGVLSDSFMSLMMAVTTSPAAKVPRTQKNRGARVAEMREGVGGKPTYERWTRYSLTNSEPL